jgi:hypothetical protein
MLKLGPALVVILVGSIVKTRSCIGGHLGWFYWVDMKFKMATTTKFGF